MRKSDLIGPVVFVLVIVAVVWFVVWAVNADEASDRRDHRNNVEAVERHCGHEIAMVFQDIVKPWDSDEEAKRYIEKCVLDKNLNVPGLG